MTELDKRIRKGEEIAALVNHYGQHLVSMTHAGLISCDRHLAIRIDDIADRLKELAAEMATNDRAAQ